MCANKDLARNPESQCSLCPNVYGKNSSHSIVAKCALSTEDSFEQGKILANTRSILLLLNDADNIKCSRSNVKHVTQVKKQADIGDVDKILLQSICLAYHYVKTNKDFRNIGLDYKIFVAEVQIWGSS